MAEDLTKTVHVADVLFHQGRGGLYAARSGLALRRWINNKVIGTTSPTVITDAANLYDLDRGEQVIITSWWFGLNTLNDSCQFQLGTTDQASGAGTFTAITGARIVDTGAAFIAGYRQWPEEFTMPIRVKYSDGVRSIVIRVTVNDNLTAVACGWEGMYERG